MAPKRRDLLKAAAGLGLAGIGGASAWAARLSEGLAPGATLSGPRIDLAVDRGAWRVRGRDGSAVLANGALPGPLLRLREGQPVRIAVHNRMREATSIHWHGLLVPSAMDGVPGLSFPGIGPGERFDYAFTPRQSGTYWYHSHSGLQEQSGLFGPLIVDPEGPDPITSDREHVLVLSDFSFLSPRRILALLKANGEAFNYQEQTLAGLISGHDQTLRQRLAWARMRMNPTDISDVTGAVYTYLINGRDPEAPWTGLFRPGERVRLRVINASAQTIFDFRIPGLSLTVAAADGQAVRPVTVDELQIANAETYDLLVTPEDKAYAVVAEASDRSGLARATLAPRPGMTAPTPPLRSRPLATMRDMGMDMSGMKMGPGMPGMSMAMRDPANAPGVRMGPGVEMIAPMPADRTAEPGQGLDHAGHRVLTYRDLVALNPNPDVRSPSRSVEIHLTGNMQRFIWGLDGVSYGQKPPPYMFRAGERVRVTLVNDTMMAHPIHLHGHFFELADGPEGFRPRKHTVNVAPAGRVSWDFTPVEGDWAFHCHMLYHMASGMFGVFAVRGGAA
ncbi:MAG: copper resistance system multicopper oxidase [Alphaproteobacteria bacterium]|nr:copper resistance system multicopper oxidase [Alphaproteobacteria bacterium]